MKKKEIKKVISFNFNDQAFMGLDKKVYTPLVKDPNWNLIERNNKSLSPPKENQFKFIMDNNEIERENERKKNNNNLNKFLKNEIKNQRMCCMPATIKSNIFQPINNNNRKESFHREESRAGKKVFLEKGNLIMINKYLIFFETPIKGKEIEILKEKCGKTKGLEQELYIVKGEKGYIANSRAKILNEKLRKGTPLSEDEKTTANSLIRICKNNENYRDLVVYRYVDSIFISQSFGIKYDPENQKSVIDTAKIIKSKIDKGKVFFQEKGFCSVSYNKEKNVFQNRDAFLVMKIPRGTNLFVTNNDKESEIIFPPNYYYDFRDCSFEDVFNDKRRRIKIRIVTFAYAGKDI